MYSLKTYLYVHMFLFMHLATQTNKFKSHIFDLITFIEWSIIIPKPDLSGQELFEELKMINMRELIRIIDSGCQSSLLIAVTITHHRSRSRSHRAIMAKAMWTQLGPFSATTSHDDVPMVFNGVIGSTREKSSDHGPSVPMDPMRR